MVRLSLGSGSLCRRRGVRGRVSEGGMGLQGAVASVPGDLGAVGA